jgi:chromosome partitioning protein
VRLAKRLSKLGENGSKIILILSKTGRSERMLANAQTYIDDAGFDYLDTMWPQRDGFQAEFDAGRAGSEASNPHLKQAALDVEKAMLACLSELPIRLPEFS